jgi:hypothetical protein
VHGTRGTDLWAPACPARLDRRPGRGPDVRTRVRLREGRSWPREAVRAHFWAGGGWRAPSRCRRRRGDHLSSTSVKGRKQRRGGGCQQVREIRNRETRQSKDKCTCHVSRYSGHERRRIGWSGNAFPFSGSRFFDQDPDLLLQLSHLSLHLETRLR